MSLPAVTRPFDDGLWPKRGRVPAFVVAVATSVNLAASLAMASFLAPGTAAGGDDLSRLEYIAAHSARTSTGWYLWELATLSLVAVFVTMNRSIDGERTAGLRALSFLAVTLGAIPDSINNLINAAILPGIARAWAAAPASAPSAAAGNALQAALAVDFHLWDRFSVVLTGALANGLYATGGWLLLTACARTPAYPRRLVAIQFPLWLATSAMVAASVAGSITGLIASVALTMACFVLWGYGSAVWLIAR